MLEITRRYKSIGHCSSMASGKSISKEWVQSLKRCSPFRKKAGNAVYDRLSIMIIWLKVLGVFPLQKDANGFVSFKWFTLSTIYTITVFMIIMALAIGLYCQKLFGGDLLVQGNLSFSDKVLHFSIIALKLFHLVPIGTFLDRNRIGNYFNEWKTCQENFEEISGKHFQVNYKMRQILSIFLVHCFGIPFYWFIYNRHVVLEEKYQWVSTHYFPYSTFTAMYCFFLIFAYGGLWFSLCRTTYTIALEISKEFKMQELEAMTIRKYRNLWMQVRSLTCGLGNAFTMTYGIFMLNLFLVNLCCIYFVALSFIGKDINIFFTAGTVIIMLYMSAVAECAYRTSERVENEFFEYLVKQTEKPHTTEIDKELQLFQTEIVNHPPTISLGGFVTLCRKFNVTVYGNFITYLIIFLQMTPNEQVESFKKNTTRIHT